MLVQTLHRLFFAIKPAMHAIPAIEAARRLYCPGRPVRSEHLHVTMEIFNDHIGLPERLVDRLIAVGNDIDMPGFLLSSGRRGRSRSGPMAARPGSPCCSARSASG